MANPNPAINMSFYQPEWTSSCFKRKFRWKFIIPSICADGVSSLPPSKAARPSLTFKTMEAQHLNETIYYPAKPEWKPLQLQLYDTLQYDALTGLPSTNPIFQWIMCAYDSTPAVPNITNATSCGAWNPSLGDIADQANLPGLKAAYALLELYDGCGVLMERWTFEHVWPEQVDWGELNYSESDVVMCDVTLRYDRAYFDQGGGNETGSIWAQAFKIAFQTTLPGDDCAPIPATSITVPASPYCQNQVQDSFLNGPPQNFAPQNFAIAQTSAIKPPIKRKFLVRK